MKIFAVGSNRDHHKNRKIQEIKKNIQTDLDRSRKMIILGIKLEGNEI